MAGRKPAAVSGKDVQAMKVPDVLALKAKVVSGAGDAGDRELLDRVLTFLRGKYQRGKVSDKVALQLGIA